MFGPCVISYLSCTLSLGPYTNILKGVSLNHTCHDPRYNKKLLFANFPDQRCHVSFWQIYKLNLTNHKVYVGCWLRLKHIPISSLFQLWMFSFKIFTMTCDFFLTLEKKRNGITLLWVHNFFLIYSHSWRKKMTLHTCESASGLGYWQQMLIFYS
jgi:hypothetical protein